MSDVFIDPRPYFDAAAALRGRPPPIVAITQPDLAHGDATQAVGDLMALVGELSAAVFVQRGLLANSLTVIGIKAMIADAPVYVRHSVVMAGETVE